jgi:hypothetical protein
MTRITYFVGTSTGSTYAVLPALSKLEAPFHVVLLGFSIVRRAQKRRGRDFDVKKL